MLKEKIVNGEYLKLMEDIRDTVEDIEFLKGNLGNLLDNPSVALKDLVEIRNTLEDIQGLQEDVDDNLNYVMIHADCIWKLQKNFVGMGMMLRLMLQKKVQEK